jgi:hypothetical protein
MWTGLFKRSGGRLDAVPVPAPPPTDPVVSSRVFPHFLEALASREAPAILDLGPVVGANIAFFGERLSCKIHVEDVLSDIEEHARRGDRKGLAGFLASRIRQAPGSVDGVLCWDTFDFLDPAAGQVLAASLTQILKRGGVLYGTFGTTVTELRQYTRTVVESASTLRPRRYPATPVSRTVRLTRDMIKMFDGLVVSESVLLKSNTRETLFRKP